MIHLKRKRREWPLLKGIKQLLKFIVCCFKGHYPIQIDYDYPAFAEYLTDTSEWWSAHLCERCGLVFWSRREKNEVVETSKKGGKV